MYKERRWNDTDKRTQKYVKKFICSVLFSPSKIRQELNQYRPQPTPSFRVKFMMKAAKGV
jgi:hypothetical protein